MEVFLFLLPLAVVLILLWPLSRLSRQTERQVRQLRALERRVRLIMDHLGISEPTHPMPDVVRQLEAGNKIQAIKAYREATGASLKEAKAAVEAIEAQLNT